MKASGWDIQLTSLSMSDVAWMFGSENRDQLVQQKSCF